MNRKLKLALAALLGFSTACSSVKNAPKKGDEPQRTETESLTEGDTLRQRIIVMYGVRRPRVDRDRIDQGQSRADSLSAPVAESSAAETPADK